MLAVISSGHADAADLFMLVAFILAAIVCVWSAFDHEIKGALGYGALAFVALGLLVL